MVLISADRVIYDQGSVYDRLHKLQDMRKARGKQYSLVGLLMVILLAKLCGADKPIEIADWGKNHQLVRKYNKQGKQGQRYALDGKALRGRRGGSRVSLERI
jgi:hypothetical protein